ncbi:MAG TPA: glutamate-1-semialdehyde 2,1-aminomutase [Acidimicrobiales bacterium]|nr:glutamate-1-semialdehyde 2,1-aminomutase [Acidimicrobiales bacterium]
MTHPGNADWFARAARVIPGGVNSPVRAFGSVGGTPYFVASAEGPYVTDVEGRRLIDLVQSYGAIIAGHAHPAIVDAVTRAARSGTSYGAPTEGEVRLAETISAAMPGVDQVRLVSSGTEATMSAIRLARGFTGRERLVKFAGNYHGHSDSLLAEAGSSVAQLADDAAGVPGSAGVPAGAVEATVVLPYNEVPTLDESVAAVIVEPIAANMGLVPPVDGFLAGLAAECARVGALLIFDEVITGFRAARGGAATLTGVTPDLVTLGKVIGGGLPVGAFGGRTEIMERLAPLGPVYQAGTLSGNPLATAAGLAALDLLDDDAYQRLGRTARRLTDGLAGAFEDAGAPLCASTAGNLVGIFAGASPPRDFVEAKATDEGLYARFFHAMLDGGVALAPGAYEVAFCGLSHSDEIIDEVVAVARNAAEGIVRP